MSNESESILVEKRVFPPFPKLVKDARVSGMDAYKALCDEASREPDEFWARLARENLVWNKQFTKVLDESEATFYKWFGDGELNVSANCLDRHLNTPVPATQAITFDISETQRAGKRVVHTYQ